MVLVILDGSSRRDLGTSYRLINKVIILIKNPEKE